MGMSVNRKSVNAARRRVRVVAERVEHPERIWPAVTRILELHEQEQFTSQGQHLSGQPWTPLSRLYRIRKRREGGGGVLVRSGSLRDSFTGTGPYAVNIRGQNFLIVGSRHPLAHLHNDGSRQGRVPRRQIANVTPEVRRDVRNAIAEYIMRGE